MVALTAVLQAADRPATFFCRHISASLPPGVTPEHFAMKSDRQAARMALCCSAETWAFASAAAKPAAQSAMANLIKHLCRMMASPRIHAAWR
jgi:hypothetical protein